MGARLVVLLGEAVAAEQLDAVQADLHRLVAAQGAGEGHVARDVATVVKLVRRYWSLLGQPERTTIISRERAYHGLAGFGTSIVGTEAFKVGVGPLPGGTARVAWDSPEALEATIEELGPEWTKPNLFRFGANAPREVKPGDVSLDLGAYNPLLGKSYTEVAAISRSTMRISSCANAAPRQRRTPPPNGSQLSVYDVSPFLIPHARGGYPIPNSSTAIFDHLAATKCPNSWTRMRRTRTRTNMRMPIPPSVLREERERRSAELRV